MPAPSKVEMLPVEVREELDRRLIERGFSGYVELAEWLTAQGYSISHAAVHRHGRKVERRIEDLKLSTDAALALRAAVPDDDGAFSEVTLRMIQERIFTVLLKAGEEDAPDLKALAGAARSVADAARAGTRLREERRKALKAAAATLAAAEKDASAGADPMEVIRRVRRDIYGIIDD